MDIELKTKWIAALRGGSFQQTQLRLRDDKGFCCLGVLCEMMDATWRADDDGDLQPRVYDRPQAGYLDDRVLAIISLPEDEQERLYQMNDGGKSFSEIADYIEQNL